MSTLSIKRRNFIIRWIQSCLLISLFVSPSYLNHNRSISAKALESNDIEGKSGIDQFDLSAPVPSQPSIGTEALPDKADLNPSVSPSPSIELQTPVDQTAPLIESHAQPSGEASSFDKPETDPVYLPEPAQNASPLPKSEESPLRATPNRLPAWAKKFKVDASQLPQPISSEPTFSSVQTQTQQELHPTNPALALDPQQVFRPGINNSPDYLLIPNLNRVAAETSKNPEFYASEIPLKQHFRWPQSTQQSVAPSSLPPLPPQGQPAFGHVFVSSLFGERRNPFGRGLEFHNGVDLVGAKGIPILATARGRVSPKGRNQGYGIHVVIDHGNGYETLYAHLSRKNVRPNQIVKRGEVVGYLGSTGRSTGPHLHYSVYLNQLAVDPKPYLFR
jgi:murein DD-endopeptidase MepM/ murein hydrolase activator NlpD